MLEINNKICELKTIFREIEKIHEIDLRTLQFKDRESREKIEKTIINSKLTQFFQHKTEVDLRAFHLIILLNTNLVCATLVENDPTVGHVVGVIPTLGTSIYFTMVNNLKLFDYLIEIVEMGSSVLCLEVVNIVAVEMKNVDHQDCSQILFDVLQTITKRILRDECIYTSMKLYDQFQSIMLICKIKDYSSHDNISKDIDDIKQTGFIFHSLIRLFRSLTEMIYGCQTIPKLNIVNLYDFQLPSKPSTWYSTSELQNRETILTSIYETVFYKIRDMFYEFDLDMFMIWHEIETNEKTLQIAIGEETYLLVETLADPIFKDNIPLSTSELVIMLESIVRKPENKNEKHDLQKSLKQKLIECSTSFDCIFLNDLNDYLLAYNIIDGIGLELSITLLKKLFDRNSWKEADIDMVKSVMKKLISIIPVEELLILFPKFIELNGHNHFLVENNLLFPTIDFTHDDENAQLYQIKEHKIIENTIRIGYCLSVETFEKIIVQAANENAEAKIFITILNTLKPLCDSEIVEKSMSVLIHILESLLKSKFNLLLPREKEKFSNLIFNLVKERIMDRDDFLSKCLLPLLYVDNINIRDLSGFLNLFKEFFINVECISTNLSMSIILLQLIQILEECRWNILDFSMDKVFACERSIEAIETIVDTLSANSIRVQSIEWLEKHLRNFSSFNSIYLVKICSSTESNTLLDKLSYLIFRPITNELLDELNANPDLFIIALSQLLMKCTRKEWHRIVENFHQGSRERIEFIVDAISNCILFLGYITYNYNNINPNHCNDVFQYLGYLVNNFLDILEKVKINSDFGKYIKRIAMVFKFIPREIISTYQFNIIKSMSEELPKLKELSPSNFDENLYNFLITLFIL